MSKLRTLLLDHFKNSMPVEVDRHYAEDIIEKLLKAEMSKLKDNK